MNERLSLHVDLLEPPTHRLKSQPLVSGRESNLDLEIEWQAQWREKDKLHQHLNS